MDTFINLAKQGYETYSESQNQNQSHVHKTGGQEPSFNSDDVNQHNQALVSCAQGEIDEDGVQNLRNAHQQAFSSEGQGPQGMAPDAMGGAAAFKVFTDMMSGGGGGSHGSSGGGDMQSKLVGMAMQHASSLFDQSGGGSSEAKQGAMNSAATYVMQLMMKKEVSSFIGGGSSGGLSGIMGMVR
ncbi:hypothetical protein F4604DRAFT_1726307 [Suillus subluteus]|nr:hypothetical protein F4604DRAFT_1726307 [Suillus subluteus]